MVRWRWHRSQSQDISASLDWPSKNDAALERCKKGATNVYSSVSETCVCSLSSEGGRSDTRDCSCSSLGIEGDDCPRKLAQAESPPPRAYLPSAQLYITRAENMSGWRGSAVQGRAVQGRAPRPHLPGGVQRRRRENASCLSHINDTHMIFPPPHFHNGDKEEKKEQCHQGSL